MTSEPQELDHLAAALVLEGARLTAHDRAASVREAEASPTLQVAVPALLADLQQVLDFLKAVTKARPRPVV